MSSEKMRERAREIDLEAWMDHYDIRLGYEAVQARKDLWDAIAAALEEVEREAEARGLERAATHAEETELLMDIWPPGETKKAFGGRVCRAIASEIRALIPSERCKHGVHGTDCFECYPSEVPNEKD